MITTGLSLAAIRGRKMALQPLRGIATQNRPLQTSEAQTGKDRYVFRWCYIAGADVSELVMSNNAWILAQSGEAALGNGFTIESMSVEIGGAVQPVFYSGNRTKSILNNDVDVKSDPVPASAFGLSRFAQGTEIWVKGLLSVAVRGTDKIPFDGVTLVAEASGNQSAWWDSTVAGTTLSSTDTAGAYTISGQGFSNRTSGYRPLLLGRFKNDRAVRSFFAAGDSISEGYLDTATDLSASLLKHGHGYIQRATRMTDGSGLLPMMNFGRWAISGSQVVSGTRNSQFYKYARFAVEQLGTNDIGAGGGGNLTTLQSNTVTLWTSLRNAGIEKIIRVKLMPRSSSSDQYTTVSGQTVNSGWNTKSQQFNDWIDTKLADGSIDVVVAGTAVKDTDPSRWTVNGTTFYMTPDGTHLSKDAAEFVAAELRPLLRSL